MTHCTSTIINLIALDHSPTPRTAAVIHRLNGQLFILATLSFI